MTNGPLDDLVPLRARLGALFLLRLVLAATVLATAFVAPRAVGAPLHRLALIVGVYLLGAVAVETRRQWRGDLPLSLVGATVLLDGVFIAGVLTLSGGPGTGLSFLVYVHLIAVTLLASYRTGLKIAVWQSLLLVVAHYLPASVTGVQPLTLSEAVFGVVTLLAVALATALCSALNERELRRSRAGFKALAEMAGELEDTHNPPEVVHVLLRALPRAIGITRAALYLREEGTISTVAHGRIVTIELPAGIPPGASVLQCWESRNPVLRKVADPLADAMIARALPGATNLVILPFTADGEPVGALIVECGPMRAGTSTLNLISQFNVHGALSHRNVRLMAEVKHLATVDGLTGLSNRRTFESALHREVARAQRTGEQLSLLLIDVDHFKRVNDEYGHPMGDEVLRHVGSVLGTRGREVDLPSRYGGEEFAIILPNCPPEEALRVADRLRAAIAGDDSPLPITASAGVAAMHHNAIDAAGLVKAADAALYEAKSRGRNRTELAHPRLKAVV